MPDHYRKRLGVLEDNTDAALATSYQNNDRQAIYAHRLEKTIIVAAAAIVEAIWKSRY